MNARREMEIRVRLPKATGGPAEVLALLAQHQIPMLTHSCYADREGLLLLLTTLRTAEAQQVLETAGYVCQTHPVVLLGPTTYRPGIVARLLTELGQQGVDIRYSYLSSTAPDRCFLIVETNNNARTLELMAAAASDVVTQISLPDEHNNQQ